MTANPPQRCLLCGSSRAVQPAKFRQQYRQADGPALPVDWWECRDCRGWFAYPVPTVEAIRRNWGEVAYANPRRQPEIFNAKQHMIKHILAGMAKRVPPGDLLDVGCNTGLFMLEAKKAGWRAFGFDPNESAAEVARQHGFEVRLGWSLDQCGYAVEQFHAVTAIDVFYYSWSPLEDLQTYFRLLRPGGVLAMRITNKRFALGAARRLTAAGPTRDARLSKMLKDQFHAISLGSLSRILQKVGFQRPCYEPHASTDRFSSMSWETRTAYLVADAIWLATFGCANVSPGIIVYAQKPASS